MKSYFQLARWKNILFLLLIQKLLEYAVVYPIFQTFGIETNFQFEYWLLNIVTMLIAAAGYVINDYFDVEIDRINKADKVIVGNTISKKVTMLLYNILTALGVLSGVVLAFKINNYLLGFIFLLTPGLLWFYSRFYKSRLLVGNFIVSFVSAISIWILAILSISILKNSYSLELLSQTPIPIQIYAWIGGFSGFAFLMTLIREIIKDMEDIEGDREQECRTMPIVWGVKIAKIITLFLIVLMIGLLIFVSKYLIDFGNNITFKYALFALIIPLLGLSFVVIKAQKQYCFNRASLLAKIIMVLGILYSFVFLLFTS